MRNTDERLAAIKQRANELEREKGRRNAMILSLSSIAACLLLVVGTAIVMPDIMERLMPNQYTNAGGMASVFSGGDEIGYVIIALLAFLLGVCVTILCVRLRLRNKEDKHND